MEMKKKEKEQDKEENIALSARLSLHASCSALFKSDLWADLLMKDACQGCIILCFT